MAAENIIEIKLKVGESASLPFTSLATAGYEWNYTIDENSDYVALEKDFLQKEFSKKYIGASADEVFTITAKKKGVTNITFSQRRSWEKEATPYKKQIVKVTIA